MLFDNSFLLMLVYVDDEWLDIAGNKYPRDGYVFAKNFTRDIDLTNGLCGIPWGKADKLVYERTDKGHWFVVKIEKTTELIRISPLQPYYKFRAGFVEHSGTLKSCAQYIIRHKDRVQYVETGRDVLPEDIVGTKEWRQKSLQSRKLLI
jgi:hypothetical protein